MDPHDQHVLIGDIVGLVQRHTILQPSLTEPPPGERRPHFPHLDDYRTVWKEMKALFERHGINLDEVKPHE